MKKKRRRATITKMNTEVIEDAIGRILDAIGEDCNRQGLVDTPKRVAKMYSEIFSGIGADLEKQLQVTFDESYNDMVTKIGEDGRAEMERHFSVHSTPNSHINPHDHKIDWSKGFPDPGAPINYPSGAPEFKFYHEVMHMSKNRMIPYDDLAFESVGDFKWHIANGCEVEFVWKGKCYSVTHPKGQICLGKAIMRRTVSATMC